MRFFKKPWFNRFARKEGISDEELKSLAAEIDEGQTRVSLGEGVYKKRLARKGGGKSGGYRILLLYRKNDRVFFVFGFAKSDQANIGSRDEAVLKAEAALLMRCADSDLDAMIAANLLIEF